MSYMGSLLGFSYDPNFNPYSGLAGLQRRSNEKVKRWRDARGNEEPNDSFNRRRRQGFRDTTQGLGLSGDYSNMERQLGWMNNIDAASPQGMHGRGGLQDTFGGRHERSPKWKSYGRGAIPTPSNFMATQPKHYHYSGGGPDPDKMMIYPGNPEMWDREGWIASADDPYQAASRFRRRQNWIRR
jgi:hypothetical protein